MDSKPWYASKTIWANAITLIATVSVSFGFDLGLTEAVRAEIVVGVLAVVNLVLRLMTTQPVVVIHPAEST